MYSQQGSLQGKFIRWFVLPVPFSKAQAAMPVQNDHWHLVDFFAASSWVTTLPHCTS
jgi:hypothetical protein